MRDINAKASKAGHYRDIAAYTFPVSHALGDRTTGPMLRECEKADVEMQLLDMDEGTEIVRGGLEEMSGAEDGE